MYNTLMKNSLVVYILFLLLLPFSLYSSEPKQKQLLTPAKTLEVLQGLNGSAITFGTGKKVIHTFIDPYCELSQRYLAFVFKKKKRMFKKYTLKFYLYELKGKKSSEVIASILSSDLKDIALKTVMINYEDLEIEDDGDAEDAIDLISEAAEKIGVYKRPYIIINGKVK
ncbi:MAG: hypothetical protein GQ570_05020 [Helicobacteraceae bacterium]|nr:hypothetical protein [Helicobacteraceae bacterium]